jgi:hypothetical protein
MPKNEPQKPRPSTGLREGFAKLFEDPSRDKLHELIKGSGGEFRDLDFKVAWPGKAAVAKQVLALGNIGGGVLIIGVNEEDDGTLTPVGVGSFSDKADITAGLKGIVPSVLVERVTVHDFDYPTGEYGVIQGMKFQVLFVEPDPSDIPFIAMKEAEKITPGVIYVRRDGMIDVATYDEVQRMLNTRIASGHSTQSELDLRAHMDQLKVLYEQIEPTKVTGIAWLTANLASGTLLQALGGQREANPLYPKETLEQFVSSQIEAKKLVVRRTIGTL